MQLESKSRLCANRTFRAFCAWCIFGAASYVGHPLGLVTLINEKEWNDIVAVTIPTLYWALVAVGLTLYARWQIKKTYEEPMHRLAQATAKVAQGDFSVYVPPLHTADKLDYLDVMILDFNKMVEELGSIETLKTDFFPMSLTR